MPRRGGGGHSIHQGRDVDALGRPDFFAPNGMSAGGAEQGESYARNWRIGGFREIPDYPKSTKSQNSFGVEIVMPKSLALRALFVSHSWFGAIK